jgi:hypothetical protein
MKQRVMFQVVLEKEVQMIEEVNTLEEIEAKFNVQPSWTPIIDRLHPFIHLSMAGSLGLLC